MSDSRDLHNELQRILTCPLTNEIFKEPVVLNCGHTFEKNPLKSRLTYQRACPYENCNRTPITLAPNEKLIKVMNLLKKHEENNKKLELDNKSNNIKSADVTKKSSNNQAKNIEPVKINDNNILSNNIKSADVTKKSSNNQAKKIEPVIINDNNILLIRLGCGHDFLLKNLHFWFDKQTTKCPKCSFEITPGWIDKLKVKMNLEDRNALSPLTNEYKLENKESQDLHKQTSLHSSAKYDKQHPKSAPTKNESDFSKGQIPVQTNNTSRTNDSLKGSIYDNKSSTQFNGTNQNLKLATQMNQEIKAEDFRKNKELNQSVKNKPITSDPKTTLDYPLYTDKRGYINDTQKKGSKESGETNTNSKKPENTSQTGNKELSGKTDRNDFQNRASLSQSVKLKPSSADQKSVSKTQYEPSNSTDKHSSSGQKINKDQVDLRKTLPANFFDSNNHNKLSKSPYENRGSNPKFSQDQHASLQAAMKNNGQVQSNTVSTKPSLSAKNIFEMLSASITKKDDLINLQINVPNCDKRNPASIVCVIDLSGSMGSAVGNAEGNKAFTRLDLVKHVLNVLIECVDESDQLALITFSSTTKLEFGLSLMSGTNKRRAKNIVHQLEQSGKTYTIPALQMAYEVIKASPENNINTIILLTDGQDTEGEVTFQRRFEQIKQTKNTQLHTFGFSNDIWSKTLRQIAVKGDGIFGFIPDQTMIGTVFLNCIASTFMTLAQNVSLLIDKKYEIVSPNLNNGKITLYYGQSKNILLKIRDNTSSSSRSDNLFVTLIKENGEKKYLTATETTFNSKLFQIQLARKKMLEFLSDRYLPDINLNNFVKSKEIQCVTEFLSEFKQIDEYDPNNEQLTLAIKDYFKWGEHYLNSMYFAHQNEQCLNFKSPSMQLYTNKNFLQLVDKLTDTFITLPLPEPTGYSYDNSAPQISARDLMNRDTGCILGTCKIKMESGEYKPINKLKKGEIVYGGSRIVCLIKMKYHGSLMKIGRLFITPFHPVFIDDNWQFPYDVVMNNNESSSSNNLIIESGEGTYVFNMVLDKHHIVDVEGVGCITLGHMYDEGILKHDYFGTNKVIEDLSKLNGWNEGFISLKSFKIQRDLNGNVCGTSDHCYE